MDYVNNLLNSNLNEDKVIIITTSSVKQQLLLKRHQLKIIDRVKIMTEQEYLESFGFLSNCDNLQLIIDNNPWQSDPLDVDSSIIVEKALYIINTYNIHTHFLYQYSQKLIQLGYEFSNVTYSEPYQVVTYLFEIDDLLKSALPENTIYLSINETVRQELSVYQFQYVVEEIQYLFEQIGLDLANGSELSQIEIIAPSDYHFLIHQIADNYKIPIKTDFQVNLSKLIDGENLQKVLDDPEQFTIESDFSQDIINVINQYVTTTHPLNYYHKQIMHKLNTTAAVVKQNGGLTLSSNISNMYTNDDFTNKHLYIVGNYQDGVITYQRDTEIIDDKVRVDFNLLTSTKHNNQVNKHFKNVINNFKNVYLSYSRSTVTAEVEISHLLNQYPRIQIFDDFVSDISEISDQLRYGHHLYLQNTFNFQTTGLEKLSNYHKVVFKDNKFTGINQEINDITLSYTSIDNFYNCKYKFYLQHILRLNPSVSNSNSLLIGNMVHLVLEKIDYNKEITSANILKVFNKYITDNGYHVSRVDDYYFTKLASFLVDVCKVMQKEEGASDLKNIQRELNYDMLLDEEYNISLSGKIDKILSKIEDDNLYLEIYDYKTGTININFDNIKYGLSMQNMIYYLLVTNEFKNEQGREYLLGTYQQQIKPMVMKQKKDAKDQTQITGYGVQSADYNFKRKVKIITHQDFDEYLKVVKEKVLSASTQIHQGDFVINPKRLKNEINSCKYCKYSTICNYKSRDIEQLT